MSKYILKRDLPFAKAGREVKGKQLGVTPTGDYMIVNGNNEIVFIADKKIIRYIIAKEEILTRVN